MERLKMENLCPWGLDNLIIFFWQGIIFRFHSIFWWCKSFSDLKSCHIKSSVMRLRSLVCWCNLPETNIAPENRPLEKEIPIGNPPFLGAMLALGSVIS